MNGFPNVDPIPLPAPIWLFKLLHMVTLALHFVAMQVLVGGLLASGGYSGGTPPPSFAWQLAQRVSYPV